MESSDRVAVVTGGGSGIGRALSELWAAAGGSVLAVDVDEGALAWTQGTGQGPGRVEALVGDVTSADANAAMIEAATRAFGGVDALVLNAGLPGPGSIEGLPLETFERVLDVNLRGVVLGLRAGIPALRKGTHPAVVVTASVSGIGADPGMWAYNAAKGGVVNLVRAAAIELASQGIRVNAVCPGPIRTGMTRPILEGAPQMATELTRNIPLQRFGEAEEVAQVIAFLASPAASFVTGAIVPVDGGVTASSGQFRPPAG